MPPKLCISLLCLLGACGTPSRVILRDAAADESVTDAGVVEDRATPTPDAGCVRDDDCLADHARAACSDGRCGPIACDEGYADCNGLASDGCERWLAGDETHCGRCASACGAREVCVQSRCDAVTAVVAGREHTCALLGMPGRVLCWGGNTSGQLGLGASAPARMELATEVPGLTGVVQLAAGRDATCALRDDGGVMCWGANTNGRGATGRLGTGDTDPVVPSARAVSGLSDAVQIAAGDETQCALTRTGTVFCWGGTGLHSIGMRDGTGFVSFSAVALPVEGAAESVQIAVGGNHICALNRLGAVRCWGGNGGGQLGIGGSTDRRSPENSEDAITVGATEVVAGARTTCAVSSGAVFCWGSLDNLGLSEALVTRPLRVADTDGWQRLTLSYRFVCGHTSAGRLGCFGENVFGQLGRGSNSSLPVGVGEVAGLRVGEVRAAAGWFHACAVADDGGLRCWGEAGALGDLGGEARNRPAPALHLP